MISTEVIHVISAGWHILDSDHVLQTKIMRRSPECDKCDM